MADLLGDGPRATALHARLLHQAQMELRDGHRDGRYARYIPEIQGRAHHGIPETVFGKDDRQRRQRDRIPIRGLQSRQRAYGTVHSENVWTGTAGERPESTENHLQTTGKPTQNARGGVVAQGHLRQPSVARRHLHGTALLHFGCAQTEREEGQEIL